MAETKNKLALALSPAELAEFCAALADVPHGELVSKIIEMAEARGISIGKTSAYGFKDGELLPHLKRIQMRKERAAQIAAMGDDDSGKTLADAAAAELGQLSFEFVSDLDGKLDLNTEEGREIYTTITKGIKSLRDGDRALIKQLKGQIDETKADLKNPQLTEEQRAARMRSRFGV
jgi:hypothetical protein